MTNSKTDHDRLLNLYDALSQSIIAASEDEIIEEYRQAGEEPAAVAESVRAIFSVQIKQYKQKRLQAARQALEETKKQQSSDGLKNKLFSLGGIAKRTVLGSILSKNPDLASSSSLTLAFRDQSELSDSDLDSILEDLVELGYIGPNDLNS